MDPTLGIATGASAAAAKAATDPKYGHALVLPTLAVIGRHWAQNTDEWFERGRAKRLANLGQHVDRAISRGERDSVDAIADEPDFVDWAENVSKVDPLDQALADVWQAALVALENKGIRRIRILNVAKRMTSDEAAAFLARIGPHGLPSKDRHLYERRFEELGLTRPILNIMSSQPLMAVASIIVIISLFVLTFRETIAAWLIEAFSDVDAQGMPRAELVGFSNTIVVGAAAVAAVSIISFFAVFNLTPRRLTTDGHLLAKLVRDLTDKERTKKNQSDVEGPIAETETKGPAKSRAKGKKKSTQKAS